MFEHLFAKELEIKTPDQFIEAVGLTGNDIKKLMLKIQGMKSNNVLFNYKTVVEEFPAEKQTAIKLFLAVTGMVYMDNPRGDVTGYIKQLFFNALEKHHSEQEVKEKLAKLFLDEKFVNSMRPSTQDVNNAYSIIIEQLGEEFVKNIIIEIFELMLIDYIEFTFKKGGML